MLHEERVTYETLKSWALDAYYDGCRDLASMKGWSHEQVLAYVVHTFEDGFERPVEDLMWRVILLVLSGGWHPNWEAGARQTITDQLSQGGLEALLLGVPREEIELFRHDLRVLELES
jgi:hypothetical protein